jgi:hypothetical protein
VAILYSSKRQGLQQVETRSVRGNTMFLLTGWAFGGCFRRYYREETSDGATGDHLSTNSQPLTCSDQEPVSPLAPFILFFAWTASGTVLSATRTVKSDGLLRVGSGSGDLFFRVFCPAAFFVLSVLLEDSPCCVSLSPSPPPHLCLYLLRDDLSRQDNTTRETT